MAIRLWLKDYEKKDHISKREKGILRFASSNFKNGHFAVGIDPLGLSTDTVRLTSKKTLRNMAELMGQLKADWSIWG